MQETKDTGEVGGIILNVGLAFHSEIDFNKFPVKRALRNAANDVRKEARRLVSRKAISQAGDFPGSQTGRLKRSIQVISSGDFWIKVGPMKTKSMKEFYPAFLFYGVTGRSRRRDHRTQPKNGSWKMAPRANYMTAALANRRSAVRAMIRSALLHSLKPR